MKSGKKLDLSLYLVLDANLCKTPEGMAETARKAVEGGCTVVQLRAPEWKEKTASSCLSSQRAPQRHGCAFHCG